MECNCIPCSFENPKPTTTAVIIRNGKLFLLKRNEEPFKGEWDFLGGYVDNGETSEEAMRREIKEEIGTDSRLTYIGQFSGMAEYEGFDYPVLASAYLAEISGEIKLNDENSEYKWFRMDEIDSVAFDSGKKILAFVKENLNFDLERFKELRSQLSGDIVDEQQVYKGVLGGTMKMIYDKDKLIGMGWCEFRDTPTRRQATIEDMIVDEEYRRRGHGEKIVKELIEWARENKCDTIDLVTHPRRIPANELYKKVGFKLHETNHYLIFL